MTIYKKDITIHDSNGERFDLNIENNGNHFSICSQSGQGYFNPKGELQGKLLDIWNTYHLNGMSSGTIEQNKLLREQGLFENYNYDNVKDYLSKHKLGGTDLSIIEYDKSNKAIEEYKKELGYFNSFVNKLLKQENETFVIYTSIEGEDKYFKDFLLSAGDSIVVKGNEIFSSTYKTRPPSSSDIQNIINKMDTVKYSDDIYLSALVDKYKGNPFIYGHAWTHVDFPNNFEEELFKLIDELIDEKETYSLRKITLDDIEDPEFIEHANDNCDGSIEKLMAACLKEGVSWSGLENVNSSNGDYWDVEGFNYSIYTDEEANEAHLESIKGLVYDIGFEGFRLGDQIDVELDDDGDIIISKKIVIEENERGNSLSSRNGNEYSQKVNSTWYYLYRN